MNDTDVGFYWFVGIAGALFMLLLVSYVAVFIKDFLMELKYLNEEIKHTAGAKQQYYIRQKRRLWLSLLPFIKY